MTVDNENPAAGGSGARGRFLDLPTYRPPALAPANDPFYAAGPTRKNNAEWFADLFNRFGFRRGVHLRRIHYVLLSTTVQTADGKEHVGDAQLVLLPPSRACGAALPRFGHGA